MPRALLLIVLVMVPVAVLGLDRDFFNMPPWKPKVSTRGLAPASAESARFPFGSHPRPPLTKITKNDPSLCAGIVDPKDLFLRAKCYAQFSFFPPECANNQAGRCCPNNCGGSFHGTCGPVTSVCNAPNHPEYTDALYWVLNSYNYTCICNEHFTGVDCMKCASGWSGPLCNQRAPIIMRKEWSTLSSGDRQKVLNTYTVLKRKIPSAFDPSMTAYDHHAMYHYWGSRDPWNNGVTYAHSSKFGAGCGFPTWHRRYVRDLEILFQNELGESNFALPYWNWTTTYNSGFDWQNDPVFTDFYGNGDPTCLADCPDKVCPIAKGPWTPWHIVDPTQKANPTHNSQWALDGSDPNQLGRALGCGNDYLSGSVNITNAMRTTNFGQFEQNLEAGFSGCNMHNGGHCFMGGWLTSPPTAANDPLFFMHHVFVDLLFETWLRSVPLTSAIYTYPDDPDYAPYGHGYSECAAPFYPLIPHKHWFNVSTTFGYDYDFLPAINHGSNDDSDDQSSDDSEESDSESDSEPEPELTPEMSNFNAQPVVPGDSNQMLAIAFGMVVAAVLCVFVVVRCGGFGLCRGKDSKIPTENSQLLPDSGSAVDVTSAH